MGLTTAHSLSGIPFLYLLVVVGEYAKKRIKIVRNTWVAQRIRQFTSLEAQYSYCTSRLTHMMIRARPPLLETGMSKSKFLADGRLLPISAPLVLVVGAMFESPNAEEVVPMRSRIWVRERRTNMLCPKDLACLSWWFGFVEWTTFVHGPKA